MPSDLTVELRDMSDHCYELWLDIANDAELMHEIDNLSDDIQAAITSTSYIASSGLLAAVADVIDKLEARVATLESQNALFGSH